MSEERLAHVIQELEANLDRAFERLEYYQADGRANMENITFGELLAYTDAICLLRCAEDKEEE